MKDTLKPLKKAVQSYVKRQHLVSLGTVQSDDHHQPIKGFMLLPKTYDQEYATGHVSGIDIALVVRSVGLPGRDTPLHRLVLEMHVPFAFPHLVALGSAHEESDLKSLMVRFHHYQRADVHPWRVFTAAESLPHVDSLRALLHELANHGIDDVEFDGAVMRLYIEELENESKIDSLVQFVTDTVKANS